MMAMTKRALTFLTATCVLWGLALPQAQQQREQQPQGPPPQMQPAHKTMRLTGCLQAGADANTFKLTGASPHQPSTSEVAPPPVGTSGGVKNYELKPAADMKDTKLSTYLGYEVEILARPIEKIPAAPPPASVETVRPEPITPEPALDAPKLEQLTVIEITKLSASCR
jgi:hypothetical protein